LAQAIQFPEQGIRTLRITLAGKRRSKKEKEKVPHLNG
jgi:hypothetical protein